MITSHERLPVGWFGVSALRVLCTLRHKFHLTGSHYFGCAGAGSDYDFIAQDSPEIREYIRWA